MDRVRAERLARELIGSTVGEWLVESFIANGASAAVFRASRHGLTAALKVVDPELEERYGREAQLERVNRELELIGKLHPNLVRIYDGGRCPQTNLLFVVMELHTANSLSHYVATFPRDQIQPIIAQIASATNFLESLKIVHRDVKPDNVVISDDLSHAVLLDLGIIRPVGTQDKEAGTGDAFIGTTRYSPPEFLLREEEDSERGWRAVTYYQLGAILYDLLMRRPLFSEVHGPAAKVIDAVRHIEPVIDVRDAPVHLVNLARACLHKDWKVRLQLVEWDHFSPGWRGSANLVVIKDRIKARQMPTAAATLAAPPDPERTIDSLIDTIDAVVRDVCVASGSFPPLQIERHRVDGARVLSVVAGPSAPHGLAQALVYELRIGIVDITSRAVQIHARAYSGDRRAYDEEGWQNLFKGLLDGAVIRDPLDYTMHLALDQIQIGNIGVEAGFIELQSREG
jgi:eukaryotic-like serine/threonine-protein kinase